MGLHRDPISYSTDPIEIHIRRLIWYQICFLDIRTCEATGPRPQIRREEYDTRFPLNVNDEDLDAAASIGVYMMKDSTSFTDMTITRMRFECYEMIRLMWIERPKLQRKVEKGEKKVTITSLLSRIQGFKAAMERTYLPMMSKSNPQHVVAMEMYGILSTRLYIMVLHTFASNDKRKMPERLRQIMISCCIMILEHSMTIEQQPALAQWSWYVGALHQYHTALLLLNEMYVTTPDPAIEARIWRCMDFAFDLPAALPPSEKARMLLRELVERTGTYATIRRMRAPSNMPHAGPRELATSKKPQQQEQAIGREERERSSSMQSGTSTFTMSSSGQGQQSYSSHPQHQQPQQQHYLQTSLPMKGPLGAIPSVDWGSFDMATTNNAAPPPPMSTTQTPYSFGGFAPTVPPPGLASMTPGGGSDTSNNPAMVGMGGGSGSGSGIGGSPMDAAINDIDWVSRARSLICVNEANACVIERMGTTLRQRISW